MQLIAPSSEYELSYIDYIKELGDEERYPYPLDLPFANFKQFICRLEGFSKGVDLPNGLVANSTYWLVDNQQILAVAHLRHKLNASLTYAGGHIGLGVRPSLRGKGLGTDLLQKTLVKAQQKGISVVHIHCYKENIASAKMITNCAGKLHSEVTLAAQEGSANSRLGCKIIQRYIIDSSHIIHK